MYYQVNRNTHATGTGIGLAVSLQIVDAMGGKLTVSSELGKGSTFKLSLPVDCLEQAEPKKDAASNLPSLSILLVEDIELNIIVAKSLLEKLGHQVDSAINGEQALQKVAANDYQLILMDIQLPDMNGYQITQKLRETHQDRLPPIVALTANVFSDKQQFIDQGMDDALGKPLSIKPLNEMITRLFVSPEKVAKEEQLQVVKVVDKSESLLDEPMLTELLEFLPSSVMLDNVALFTKVMPDYLHILDSNMIAKDKDGIVNEAHKIKGAAGSVGLKRIQNLSQKIQSPELPAWWDNIDDWVELIKSQYQSDIVELKKWIVSHGK